LGDRPTRLARDGARHLGDRLAPCVGSSALHLEMLVLSEGAACTHGPEQSGRWIEFPRPGRLDHPSFVISRDCVEKRFHIPA
jgi:hypothetical protein